MVDPEETEAITLRAFAAAIQADIGAANDFLGALVDDFSGDATILLGLQGDNGAQQAGNEEQIFHLHETI